MSMKTWKSTILLPCLFLLFWFPGAWAGLKRVEESAADKVKETTCSSQDGTCEAEELPRCDDLREECGLWADEGECTANPGYMSENCALSCGECLPTDVDGYGGEDIDLGVDQTLDHHIFSSVDIQMALYEAKEYLRTTSMKKSLRDKCKNQNVDCTIWALEGECDANPQYMKKHCAPVCQSCYYLSTETRCPIDPEAPIAWQEGDLDKMFQKLTKEPYLTKYNVTILSSPETNGPWVITMENLVQNDESDRLMDLGDQMGFERSKGMAKIHPDGTPEHSISDSRTSTQNWCQKGCVNDPKVRPLIERLSNLTGIDEMNSEFLQLLHYEPGQYYRSHHDYLVNELKRQQGVRILTVYLYLNDVEEGGGTEFDKLGITVMPKKGMAVLWPSVLNHDTMAKDHRTSHAALPVIKGVKYGANAWFHLRDFKTPYENSCTE